jgi:sulfide:quinone oxidoreductase
MDIRKLTDELAVAGQIVPGDIPDLAAAGIRAIICNRPDGEAPGQASYSEIEKAAAANGIEIVYQPVSPNSIADSDAEAFGKALSELPKPLLAYCRSGTRCAVLWSLSEAGKRPAEDILRTAARAGYDLTPFLPRLGK